MKNSDSNIDNYFLRNTIGISFVELFWGLGLPVVMESTFLQLFLKHLGATNFLIGFVSTLFFIGLAFFSLFSGFFTAHLQNKKNAVILLHLFASLPMLIFGVFLKFTGFVPGTLNFFLIAYAFFSIGIGLILPTWQNYLVKIYSDKKIISGHSIMWIFQSLGKFLSGFVILKIISKYSFTPDGVSLIFSLVGITFIAGSLMFLITVESLDIKHSETNKKTKLYFRSKLKSFSKDLHEALKNKNFLFFLASDLEQYAIISIMAFYANYATEYCDINISVAAGIFVIFNYSGAISINLLLGRTGTRNLKNKYMTAKIISFCTVLVLFFFSGLWAFFAASFLMGISRGTRSLVYMPFIKKLTGQQDSTNYFSIAPLIVMPVSSGLPLLAGTFLDRFTYLEGDSYRTMFLAMGALILLGIFFLSKVQIERD